MSPFLLPGEGRQSIRIRGWDYTQYGPYFVTVCVHGLQCVFGTVVGGRMVPSRAGHIVKAEWSQLPARFLGLDPIAFTLMPNHVHLIAGMPGDGSASLSAVIGAWKSMTTRRIRAEAEPGFRWQRGFWDVLVEHERQQDALIEYIEANPWNWTRDPMYRRGSPRRP